MKPQLKNIFYIAYQFPPLNAGGTQRPLKFVKYLPDFGVNPIVFTLDPDNYSQVFRRFHLDQETLNEIPANIDIIRVPSSAIINDSQGKLSTFLTSFFSILPREAHHWEKNIYEAFAQRIDKYKPEALIATAPPFSMAPLAIKLSKKFDLPLILDMRDAWSGWNTIPYASYIHYFLTLRKERQCFQKAAAVIATSQQTLHNFKSLHPMLSADKFHYIPNGYDAQITDWAMPPPPAQQEFVIGYVGSFYYSPASRELMLTPAWKKRAHRKLQYTPEKEDWLYRSPYFFFKAVRELMAKHPVAAKKIRIKFAGSKPEWMNDMVQEFGLENSIEFLGRIPRSESLEFQSQCDALLLTSSKVIGGLDYSIAGKTYEYISMKKPLVGFVCDGAQKELLKQTGTAIICDPDETASSSDQLAQLINGDWIAKPNKTVLDSLCRKKLSSKLSTLIHSLAATR